MATNKNPEATEATPPAVEQTKPENPAPPIDTRGEPNLIWRGDGDPPSAYHGLTIQGQAVTLDVPPDAANGFYSPYPGVLRELNDGFKWFNPGVKE